MYVCAKCVVPCIDRAVGYYCTPGTIVSCATGGVSVLSWEDMCGNSNENHAIQLQLHDSCIFQQLESMLCAWFQLIHARRDRRPKHHTLV